MKSFRRRNCKNFMIGFEIPVDIAQAGKALNSILKRSNVA